MTGQYRPGHGFDGGDPRMALARALMGQGASTAPVQSPLEGLARALQGPLGGYMGNRVKAGRQEGMTAAMAALRDQSLPQDQRLAAGSAAYRNADPGGDDPFAGAEMNALIQSFMPKPPMKLAKGDRLIDQTTNKELVPAAPDLPQGFRLNEQTGVVEVMPGFQPAVTGLKKAESAATAQGKADVDLVMGPQQIRAETGPKAALAGAEAAAKAPYQAIPVQAGGTVVAPFAKGGSGPAVVGGGGGSPAGPGGVPAGTGAPPQDPRILYKDPRLPADVQAKLDTALANSGAISNALSDFAKAFEGAGAGERAQSVAGIQTPLNTAYNKAALLAKGQELFDLGVLNGPDLDIIRRTLPDPSTFAGQASGAESAKAATDSVRVLLQDRINGFLKQKGLPAVDLVAYGKSLRPGAEKPAEVSRETPAAASGAPAAGAVVSGYKFLGGDPNDKTRWEAVP